MCSKLPPVEGLSGEVKVSIERGEEGSREIAQVYLYFLYGFLGCLLVFVQFLMILYLGLALLPGPWNPCYCKLLGRLGGNMVKPSNTFT